MNFFDPRFLIPRSKILKMLSIGNRYNASLVWEELGEEIWRSTTTASEFIERVTINEYGIQVITNLENLETAGVFASAGILDNVYNMMFLKDVDVSMIQANFVNSAVEKVSNTLVLWGVTGFCSSMFENIQCRGQLDIVDMKIPQHVTCDICVSGMVHLENNSGDLSGLLEGITCDTLFLADQTLTSDEVRSLSEMLQSRVRKLILKKCEVSSLEFCSLLLDSYDGQGCCEIIELEDFGNGIHFIKDNLTPWVDSNGWTMMTSYGNIDLDLQIKRSAF